ncbi:hypothetical protein Emtol_3794 [Emticicia oligotrophica DSM 17448]|uniref:THUMP-like domain-containing protein n=2 Tax=Emticicia TaxID=312278 RepID=A0ABM5N5W2_EMTOG|nr:hypothetical protein Emtol_3794 [Emticicia oligotrophica DSM 17448]
MIEAMIEASKIAQQFQNTNVQEFILKNPLKLSSNTLTLVADQLLARQKSKTKLPTWFANPKILFPPPLSVEQASSEVTANFKASVFSQLIGKKNVVDLTGGMGVDSWALAKICESVKYIEQSELLSEIAKVNFKSLNLTNIEVINQNATTLDYSFLKNNNNYYIDPHRRDNSQNKVFKIEDCEPNLLTLKPFLNKYMVKFSPMLDIKMALEQLTNISYVYVIAFENEVKELLFISNGIDSNPNIVCVNLSFKSLPHIFEFDYTLEEHCKIAYSNPLKYIYEPNASILKAGGFKSVSEKFNLLKIAPNSHLYTSDILNEAFPGRIFLCESICKFDKKEILSKLPSPKANISTRNFPLKPEEIKKKLGLQDGGDYYLFATENSEKQKIVLLCKKVEL